MARQNNTVSPAFLVARRQLLQNELAALHSYVQGIAAMAASAAAWREDLIAAEEAWLHSITNAQFRAELGGWAHRLLVLARHGQRTVPRAMAMHAVIRAPVLIVAGGAATLSADDLQEVTAILSRVFMGLRGTVISGGTACGVAGCVGAAAAAQGEQRMFKLIGVRPERLPEGIAADHRYDVVMAAGRDSFNLEQVLHYWEELSSAGIAPGEIRLLGYGGGAIAAFEYRLALAMGAVVSVVEASGGTADALLTEAFWRRLPNLVVLHRKKGELA